MAPVAPPGDQWIRVSNAAARPFPAGIRSSQSRMDGCVRSGSLGACCPSSAIRSRIELVASRNAMTGAPATMRSASARTGAGRFIRREDGRLGAKTGRDRTRDRCGVAPVGLVDHDGFHGRTSD